MDCRYCQTVLERVFLDLGFAPPSNAYLVLEDLKKPEKYYPLKIMVCHKCWLVQTQDYTQAEELFTHNYSYFSSTSISYLAHASQYVEQIIQRLELSKKKLVIEIACNDGYLLKNFVARDIPCIGIEPTDSTAAAAEDLGITVIREFFSEELGIKIVNTHGLATLIVGNNVYAHVPDINDFTRGLKALLKIGGTITLEFPHLMRLIDQTQFDTIYHEHFSYLSLYTVVNIFRSHGLRIFDVENLSTHGGSLRVYACHEEDIRNTTDSVIFLLAKETSYGLQTLSTYNNFQDKANKIKYELQMFLIEQKKSGKQVLAYGAAAKGNTLLNYAGVRADLLPFIGDAALSKYGKYMPGSHIPIVSPEILIKKNPDYIIILPWNIRDEIIQQIYTNYNWRGKFVTFIPFFQYFKS